MASQESRPPATDSAHFRKVLGAFPTGVTVVTAVDDGKPVGMAIGSFTSVSLDPPLVAFLPTKASSTWASIERAGSFCVNVMADDQGALCAQFASRMDDKFEGVDWEPTDDTGAPRLANCIAWMDCTTDAVHDAGDHVIVVGRVEAMDVDREAPPLLFFKGQYGTFAG
ncbi:MAG: flavin reductase family protein [Acidimicrobiia bacterium]|nr:flavin reductase family protein [Acidimicrobiia bacterium]